MLHSIDICALLARLKRRKICLSIDLSTKVTLRLVLIVCPTIRRIKHACGCRKYNCGSPSYQNASPVGVTNRPSFRGGSARLSLNDLL